MDQNDAWKCFENTGSVEAYLLYHAFEDKEKQSGYDVQGQGDPVADRSDRS